MSFKKTILCHYFILEKNRENQQCALVSTAFALNVHIQGTIYFANDLLAFNTNTLILCMISGQYLRCYRSIIFRKSFVFNILSKNSNGNSTRHTSYTYSEKPTKFEKNISTFTLKWVIFFKFCDLLRKPELYCCVEKSIKIFDKMVTKRDFLKSIDLYQGGSSLQSCHIHS